VRKADLEDGNLQTALRYFFFAQTPYKVTVGLNKLSICFLYMRLFVTRRFRIACGIVIGVLIAWSIGAVVATVCQCIPIAASWDKSVEANCIDKPRFWVAYAVVNILTDVLVLGLPIPPVLRLQLSSRDKLLVCATFLMGAL
jgi:phage-related holin